MNLEKIKNQLEANKSFLYWRDNIGLSFEDFSIYKPVNSSQWEYKIADSSRWEALKNGKKDIGNYYIVIEDEITNEVISISFDMNSETVRQHTLKKINKVS